jgi:hypothetical protein
MTAFTESRNGSRRDLAGVLQRAEDRVVRPARAASRTQEAFGW